MKNHINQTSQKITLACWRKQHSDTV